MYSLLHTFDRITTVTWDIYIYMGGRKNPPFTHYTHTGTYIHTYMEENTHYITNIKKIKHKI